MSTPQHLTERIADIPESLEGERKQVTILFADVVGSTALIQGRDDEEAQRLLDGAVQRMVDAVHRYEGTVSRRMGDGLMAMFGAPVAHEDHAVRACYAALAMLEATRTYADEAQRAGEPVIQIRVGLNSGGVIVRLISNDRHLDYTAMGETVHLAARMEQLAAPDSIAISPATRSLAEGFIEVQPLGPRGAKGFEWPIEVYEVVGAGPARTRLQATSARGLTPFVGRDQERAAIDRALARSQGGQGQVVALVAEPGVGKSRLVWEATRSDRTHGSRVLQTGALSYGQTTTWLPIVDLLRSFFQIDSRDDRAVMRDKVAAGLRSLDPSLEPAQAALLSLLDVPVEDAAWTQLDPAQRRRATHEAVQQLLLRESQRQSLLLVFEDLHWIDSETQALLDALVESLPAARILLLVSYRPEYAHAWGSKSYYTQLRIDPLGEDGAWALLDALLGSDPSVQPLTTLLIQRTEGTPLFLEESVRALVETGVLAGERGAYRLTRPVEEIRVPATVQTVLAARIDRLPAEEKRLLQTAAVIGKDVPFVLLQGITGRPEAELQASLSRLQAGELLYPTVLFPDPEYTFKHALTHDVAYGSLLNERRKALHARIVVAIEQLYADRRDEHVERLAQHAVRGEVWDRAVVYCGQAGGRAADRSATREAVGYLEGALAALDRLPPSRPKAEQAIDLRSSLQQVLFQLAEIERIAALDQEKLALADSLGDERRLGLVLMQHANLLWRVGEYGAAIVAGQRAHAIGAELNDHALRARALHQLGNAHGSLGEWRAACDYYEQVVGLVRDQALSGRWGASTFLLLHSWGWLAFALSQLGDFSRAVAYGTEAVERGDAAGHAFTLCNVSGQLGQTYLQMGEADRAIPLLERALDICKAYGYAISLAWLLSELGAAHALLGQFDRALALADEARTADAASPAISPRSGVLLRLSEIDIRAGLLDEAEHLARSVMEQTTKRGERGCLARATGLLAEVLLRRNTPARDLTAHRFTEAVSLAEELGMRPFQAHCHLGLGKLYRRMDRLDEARAELETALAMLREMGMAFWLPEAERELGEAST